MTTRATAALLLLSLAACPARAWPQQGAAEVGAPHALPPGMKRAPSAQERYLVEVGALLLPEWRFEVAPEVGYAHDAGKTLAPVEGGLALVQQRSDRGTAALTARLGLPLRLQAEVRVPFAYVSQTLTGVTGAQREEEGGIGDVRTALTWNPVAGQAFPDVLVTGFWRARTGKSLLDTQPAAVAVGSGIEQFGGTVALVQATAPVALRVSGTYAYGVSRWTSAGWTEPGWELGGAVGAVFAVAQGTALSLGLDAGRTAELRVEHAAVPDTELTSVYLRAGVGTLAASRGFLQLDVSVGLTEDVRGVQVAVTAPVLF